MSYGDKPRDWFIENGYRYDLRNHCWIRDDISNIIESPVRNRKTNSEPIFFKVYNIKIFNNCQYPLKFHEVMYEK